MSRLIFPFIILILLSGCASSGIGGGYGNSNFYQLNLQQPVTVKAGSSYAYVISPGQVVDRSEIGTYELYCKFSIPRSKQSEQITIKPDVFAIENIYRRYAGILPSPRHYQLAYNNLHTGFFGHHNSSKQDLELHMDIYSENQPQIKSISCVRFSDPYFDYAPTLREAQHVFKGLAEFESV